MPSWLATKRRGVTSQVSPLSAQRAQFTFSTQGIVTHSQARGGEAGSQPTFFRRARGFVQTFNWRVGLECLRKVTVTFHFCAPRPSARTTTWGPFFICRIPSSCRAPADLEISRQSYSSFIFYSTLKKMKNNFWIKWHMRTVSTSPYYIYIIVVKAILIIWADSCSD